MDVDGRRFGVRERLDFHLALKLLGFHFASYCELDLIRLRRIVRGRHVLYRVIAAVRGLGWVCPRMRDGVRKDRGGWSTTEKLVSLNVEEILWC